MKKYFEYVGLIVLICFSFFVTEQTASVVKEIDDIMIQIKSNYLSFTKVGVDAVINDKEMIPGLVTKKVNIEKSYQLMKEKGIYDSAFYVYDVLPPSITTSNIFDKKIILGNKQKKMVSLVFFIDNSNDDKISRLFEKGVPINIILSSYNIDILAKYLENNSNVNVLVEEIKEDNYHLINTKLKAINAKIDYCYNKLSSWCEQNKIYTISEKNIIETKTLLTVKNKLVTDNILIFRLNDEVLNELPTIIQYIKSKGYTVSLLTEHLSENW